MKAILVAGSDSRHWELETHFYSLCLADTRTNAFCGYGLPCSNARKRQEGRWQAVLSLGKLLERASVREIEYCSSSSQS